MEKRESDRRDFLKTSALVAMTGAVPALAQEKKFGEPVPGHHEPAFHVGVAYYRAPMPPQEMWDDDFARIKKAGIHSVRSFTSWNWIEPAPGKYELSDFDHFFELAEKHGLKVVFDFTLSTHMACPDWMLRRHPDMRVVFHTGEVAEAFSTSATVQGGNRHCYDHPEWKKYGGDLVREVVNRYKNSPAMGMWVAWDGPGLPGLGNDVNRPGRSCYCVHTLAKYKKWLQRRFTLDQLGERLGMRYSSWDDIDAPRSHHLIMAQVLFHEFLYQNLAETLRWKVNLIRSLDDEHEIHAHGFRYPNVLDEVCARECDSWGFAAHSTNLFESEDPYHFGNIAFASDWSRGVGKNHRWWYTEIYAGMYHTGLKYRKQSTAEDISMSMWLGLANAAAGAILWQYRPEYGTHEAPGLNLVSPAGVPNSRFKAVEKTLRRIGKFEQHLPIKVPQAEVGIVFDNNSAQLAELETAKVERWRQIKGVHRSLWEQNIPVDMLTSSMDWSGYKVIYLPNVMLVDEPLIKKIADTLRQRPDTHIIADGLLGTNAASGRFSYDPPEGLTELLGVQSFEFTHIDDRDIEAGKNTIRTIFGDLKVTRPENYISLIPHGNAKPIAHRGDEIVGVQAHDGRFTWITLPLGTAFGGLAPAMLKDLPYAQDFAGVAPPEFLLPLLSSAGVESPVATKGDKVIVLRREGTQSGVLFFVINFEDTPAEVWVQPQQAIVSAQNLEGGPLVLRQRGFDLKIPPRDLKVVHCVV